MGDDRFDLVVVGGGPGGYAAALYAASGGMQVALVEMGKVGGTCLHVGCIPAKELLETAAVRRTLTKAPTFGFALEEPSFDPSVSRQRRQKVVSRLHKGLESLLSGRKVTVVPGRGRLVQKGRVLVDAEGDETMLEAEAVILAPGSSPRLLDGVEVDGEVVVTSDEFFDIERLPERAVVVGGGAIGCEFASALIDLGVEVTILEALPAILPGCDPDVVKVLHRSLEKRGVNIETSVSLRAVKRDARGARVEWSPDGSAEADLVVVAIGRRPRTETLELGGTGVEVDDKGFIRVDSRCRTTLEGVWAVGDAVNSPQLAHVAFAEAMLAVKDILGEQVTPIDYDKVPWCIYTHPEVAFAGLTEPKARERTGEVVTATHRFAANGRALILGEGEGMAKLVAERRDRSSPRLLGVHLVGPWVTEQLGAGYFSVNWEADASDLSQLIQPHPTLSESFGEAALALTGRILH